MKAPEAAADDRVAVRLAYSESGLWPAATVTRVASEAARGSAVRRLGKYGWLLTMWSISRTALATLAAADPSDVDDEGDVEVMEIIPMYVTA